MRNHRWPMPRREAKERRVCDAKYSLEARCYLQNHVQWSFEREITSMSTNEVANRKDQSVGEELEHAVQMIEREWIGTAT